jgi:putative phosphoesterase
MRKGEGMKIGVISDTHLAGYDEGLKRLLNDHFLDVDLILHAGDLVDIGVLDIFAGKDVRAVCGNMDPPSVRRMLPERLIFNLNNFTIALIHGWGMPFGIENKLLKEIGRVDCLIYGHTHRAANVVRDGVLFFNPGSATDRRFATLNTVGILEVGKGIKGEIIELQET